MKVNIGDELEFEVFRLDSDTAGVFFIRGKLDWRLEAEALHRMKEISEEQNANLPDNEVQNGSEVAEEAVVGETSILPEASPKRIGKRLFEETLSQNECIENQEDTNLSLEEAPKKRRKKHRHLEVLPQDHSVEAMEISSIHQDSLRNTDNDVAVDSSVGGLDDMLVVPSSQERKAKKSKKKKRKDHLDHESSVNSIITEESSIMGDSMLEGLGTELGTTKKKHKKHKNASMILDEDPTAASASSLETPTDNFRIQQKTSKKKRHKHHPDLESSVNIVTDESSITGASMLEGLGTQPATTEKKHKKHKNTSMILAEDPTAAPFSSLSPTPNFIIQQETSKKKRHKHHPDLEGSVHNGMMEESSITGDSTLEGLWTEPGTTEKKRRKKHKNTSMIL
ncbi:hypothetical protein GDO78_003050 [Eleutherodactylus coqui]|uniref:Uncharacterized protein n=1 Tax=Eleutherodactylus coqui TaxID=57060 RepID=A0A8J6EX41_ELECQ|nr:hypothetical protein GDO78_003050 [Eleutherodactylus coqui]